MKARECECGDHAFILTSRGLIALVSAQDATLIENRKWSAAPSGNGRSFYAKTWVKDIGRGESMHRIIMSDGPAVDHINRNGMDNRRANLRYATPSQNVANGRASRGKSSKYRGVQWAKNKGWLAVVTLRGKMVFRKRFPTEVEAAMAYDSEAVKVFGEFASTNRDLGLLRDFESSMISHAEGEKG